MTVPNCPDHGNLVLELARGLLDDREAMRAEEARVGCDHCLSWWNGTFGDDSVSLLDTAVDEVFSSWEPPVRRRHVWMAAAAAALLAVGLGTTTLVRRDGEVSSAAAGNPSTAGELLSTMDFEDGVAENVITDADRAGEVLGATDGDPSVFTSGLESGDLSSWSSSS